MSLRSATLALALICLLPMTSTTRAADITADSRNTLLSIATSAEASRTPDVAALSTGVVTQSGDASSAMRSNAVQMDKVMTALRAAGIADRDIQTSGINLNPQYRYADNQPPAIVGYQASNTVNIKVRALDKLGKVLDALVAQGANQINGPSFDIDQPEAAYTEARIAAVKKAQAQAQTYADALGMRVLRIVSINEGGSSQPQPMPMRMRVMAAAAPMEKSTPAAIGESSVSVSLEMLFELGR